MFGSPYKGIKNIKVSLVGDKGKTHDATSNAKLSKDKTSVTVTPPTLDIGKYQVLFELETSTTINLNSSIRVTDKLKVTTLSYKVSANKAFPAKLDSSLDFGKQVPKALEV